MTDNNKIKSDFWKRTVQQCILRYTNKNGSNEKWHNITFKFSRDIWRCIMRLISWYGDTYDVKNRIFCMYCFKGQKKCAVFIYALKFIPAAILIDFCNQMVWVGTYLYIMLAVTARIIMLQESMTRHDTSQIEAFNRLTHIQKRQVSRYKSTNGDDMIISSLVFDVHIFIYTIRWLHSLCRVHLGSHQTPH